jgi:glycosyltransferase involved in cell wall biosynthesis
MQGGEARQTAVRRAGHGGRGRRIDAGGFEPTWVGELELSRPVSDLIAPVGPGGRPYRRARLLVRVHGQPIGFLELGLRDGGAAATTTLSAIEGALGDAIADHLRADGIEPEQLAHTGIAAVDQAPCEAPGSHGAADALATVIVCTRDRPASLRRTLGSLLEGDYPNYEILVVDNDPAKPATRSVVADLGGNVRYSAEPLPGLSRARNRGVREARGEVLAFIDDDVIADRGWLRNVVLGFTRAASVGCVTGFVPAAELDTPAQAFFDGKVQWAASTERRLYDLTVNRVEHPLYPYIPGIFGAFTAISSAAAERIGSFDEALGAGTPAQGGEDLDYLLRVILAGYAISHEPAALGWHVHRRDEESLRRQVFGYGSGLSAYAFKQLLGRRTAADVVRRLPRSLRRVGHLMAPATEVPGLPSGLWAEELRGLALGPLNLLRGRRRRRELGSRCGSQ